MLKEEVTRRPHLYICGCTKLITYTLTKSDLVVQCLLAFGTSALLYAVEILVTIEWGTQHWKMEEPFPVPPVPKWLCTPQLMQSMMPLRGELPLPLPGVHMTDILVRSPAVWSWMAMLLQYWQDHISTPLYSSWVREASELARVLIRDINPWLPHKVRFSWDYVTNHATLWLDIWDQFVKEHFQEWEGPWNMTPNLPTTGVWLGDRRRVMPLTAMRRRPRSCHQCVRPHENY